MKKRTIKVLIFFLILCSTQVVDLFIIILSSVYSNTTIPFSWVIRFLILCVLLYIIWPISVFNLKRTKLSIPLIIYASYMFIVNSLHGELLLGVAMSLRILMISLILYAGYKYESKSMLKEEQLSIMCWIILILTITIQLSGYFFTDIRTYGSQYTMVGFTERPTGPAYAYASIFPYFVSKNNLEYRDWLAVILVIFFTIATYRRSAFIAIAIAFLISTLFKIIMNKFQFKKIKYFMSLIVAIGCIICIFSWTKLGKGFISRLEEINPHAGGTASGRYLFWNAAVSYLLSLDITSLLTGEGPGAALDLMFRTFGDPVGTHNLWLHTIISFGIFGFFLLCIFFSRLFILAFKSLKQGQLYLLVSSISLIILSITTGAGFSPDFMPLYALIGYSIAKYQNKECLCRTGASGNYVRKLKNEEN